MKRIFLDTNFLLIPFVYKVDIFSEIKRIMDEPYKICILDMTIDELNKIIAEQSGKDKEAAKMALQLIEKMNITIIEVKEQNLYMNLNSKEPIVDDILVKLADENTIIATQDKLLKKRLNKVIVLRSKKRLEYVL